MENMVKTTEELLREHIETLPLEVAAAVSEFKWDEAIAKIAGKYGLRIDQMGKLRFEALAASTGLTNLMDFFPTIKKELALSDEQAINLTNDVNEEIFTVLRKTIKEKMGDTRTEEEEAKEAGITAEEEADIKFVGERFNNLPDELQEAIIDPELPEKIALVAREHGVEPNQLDGLVNTVLFAIVDPDNFTREAKEELNLSEEKAAALAKSAEETIWRDIKGKIKEVIAKEEMADKIGGTLARIESEKAGLRGIGARVEVAAHEAAKKTLLEEKLKGQFRIPATSVAVAPCIGAPPPAGKPVAPPAAPAQNIDPYRERPV
jgi:hypothetical protein